VHPALMIGREATGGTKRTSAHADLCRARNAVTALLQNWSLLFGVVPKQ